MERSSEGLTAQSNHGTKGAHVVLFESVGADEEVTAAAVRAVHDGGIAALRVRLGG
jgi:hypothetical protein